MMPAESRQSHLSISTLLGGLLGAVFLLYNVWSFAEHYRLMRTGATLQAQVMRASVARRKGGITYNIEYAFNLEGKPYEGQGQLSQKTFGTLRIGGPIAIRYASRNPTISEPEEMSHDNASLFLYGVVGIPISLFILYVAFRRERKTLDQGKGPRAIPLNLPPRVRAIAFILPEHRD